MNDGGHRSYASVRPTRHLKFLKCGLDLGPAVSQRSRAVRYQKGQDGRDLQHRLRRSAHRLCCRWLQAKFLHVGSKAKGSCAKTLRSTKLQRRCLNHGLPLCITRRRRRMVRRQHHGHRCAYPPFALAGSSVGRPRLPTFQPQSPAGDLPLPRRPAGGLLTYGFNIIEPHRSPAEYIDRILKGANPGDLPVQEPTKFELGINLKTAKTLGLIVPLTLQAIANEMIE
jgi:hypothetical protein